VATIDRTRAIMSTPYGTCHDCGYQPRPTATANRVTGPGGHQALRIDYSARRGVAPGGCVYLDLRGALHIEGPGRRGGRVAEGDSHGSS